MFRYSTRALISALCLAFTFGMPTGVKAQTQPEVKGRIDWGAWIDDDGCMHWWADGGVEGYMAKELGVGPDEIAKLRALYLEA